MAQSPKDIVTALMIGAVPEREADIRALWRQYNPDVVIEDAGRFKLEATGRAITMDVRTPEVFWLIGFAGWRAI